MAARLPDSSSGEPRFLLAIESSCDETAAAVIDGDLNVGSNVVASQSALHESFGGVVPEIASRAHVERILPVVDEALKQAGVSLEEIGLLAIVTQPGLVGSLLVGLTSAKTLAMALGVPLVAVNHLEAHVYACRMAAGRDVFPAIGLVVSGGHTNLYRCRDAVTYEQIGATIDDAAGEAFDKVAQILGLTYPGGPVVERAARGGNPQSVDFPRTFLNEPRLDFSFSGLKTAVRYAVTGTPGSGRQPPPLTEDRLADLCASFQEAVVDVLAEKCRQALSHCGLKRLCVGGGVAANGRFREKLGTLAERERIELFLAPLPLCTDNAAMAALAWEHYRRGHIADFTVDASPRAR